MEEVEEVEKVENPQTYSSRDRSYWRDTRNDPSLKRSANRRESAWAKKDKRQTTTLKVAAHLPAALTKRQSPPRPCHQGREGSRRFEKVPRVCVFRVFEKAHQLQQHARIQSSPSLYLFDLGEGFD